MKSFLKNKWAGMIGVCKHNNNVAIIGILNDLTDQNTIRKMKQFIQNVAIFFLQ